MKKSTVAIIRNLILLLGLLTAFPAVGSAHAVLVQADPPPNSHLESPPETITLTFNERLEKELYYIHVYDRFGNNQARTPARMSLNQKQISQDLPALQDGVYTISYHIISADGHPVEQAYIIRIGSPDLSQGAGLASTGGKANHSHEGFAVWLDRLLYYGGLLFLCGWLFWGMVFPAASDSARSRYRFWLTNLKWLNGFMLFGTAFVQFSGQLEGIGWGGLPTALFHTTFGLTWLLTIAVTVPGWFWFHRWKWFDSLWIVVVLACEAMNGHAFSAAAALFAMLFDFVHLAAACVWAGGLLYILVFLKKDRQQLEAFVPRFSFAALLSIAVLVVTGIGQALLLNSDWSGWLRTGWGWMILAKAALVALVVAVAAILRRAWSRGRSPHFSKWIVRDFVLLILIVSVTGWLTNASPSSQNTPLYWTASSRGISLKLSVEPNNPGVDNSFSVEVRMPDQAQPKRVEMWLKHPKRPTIPDIQVPLERVPASASAGAVSLQGRGMYLSVPGAWQVVVQVYDQDDGETSFTKTMRLVQVQGLE